MKHLKLPAAILCLFLLIFSSCDSDESELQKTSDLEKVSFDSMPTKTISSEKTGASKLNPTTGNTEYEYLEKVEESKTINPLLVFDSSQSNDIIYPGSILRGASFVKGSYDPLVLSTPFNDVTLSVDLKGTGFPGAFTTKPTLSAIRGTLNSFLFNNIGVYDPNAIPADYTYQSDSIYSSNTFSKSLSVHVEANVLAGMITANFNYASNTSSATSKNYVMVKVYQKFYNASIDPKFISTWIGGDIKATECGSHEPLYISSVDYGRIAYLLIETDLSTTEITKMVNAAVGVKFLQWSASTDVAYNEKFTSLWSSNNIKVKVLGGPAGVITNYNEFMAFIKAPSTQDLVNTSVPIAYKVRRLLDNTQVDVVGRFEKEYTIYKTN
ncbi:thiol-activated cytolysin family protein [Mariniflexile ostreae]|uniref:Thiol-activated cytolysin family protein n=1 Tax=Mariniflexile ostreae TaxID=1520892 RepID=A0ABV5FF28_9FLAO